ncbi:hypothetical protein MCOR27_002281 [Pyricularia oryzae]|uniref:Uncharacterized protein n=2 Tax=Pyricularia TaxID=48558 RepID=A0ABQ8NI53_PYRGI|nr:hypothetical protein MCOR01_006177 [Pyricularia oryzae]KAI6297496.1 hypothetical protein MCOR33_006224 [Pyricularia grisea]KAH9435488.1 hypothetical protein MCOR02_004420 [Pyricularia oryzae]KAI6258424.1 hypothetical protein MCOR19_005225 [Pyricularia oryzae]KAI6270836.1 hypothetical protein MCOR26_008052 [Pyricularia oryzae]
MSGSNAWLRAQRKSELIGIAEHVGLKNYDGLKKDLELTLDEHLAANSDRYSSDPKLAPYFQSRNRTIGSPIKKDVPEFKIPKRRMGSKTDSEIIAATAVDDEPSIASTTSALVHTPARAFSIAQRIPLPATPAEVAEAVDRSTAVVRQHVNSVLAESSIPEYTQATRQSLSTVTAVLLTAHLFELYFLRQELLADRYAFTIPAIKALGTRDYIINMPDLFLLLTSSFWKPASIWMLTSFIIPSFFGYFFNLSAANSHSPGVATRGRPRGVTHDVEYRVDPLTYSVVKAVISYVVYAQGAALGGYVDPNSVARINSALYGGWKGVLVGSGITGLMAMYDAVLRK